MQNAAARLISFTRKCDHISPILYNLHWLPVEQRIDYKILLITFKILNGTSPSYLSNLIEPYKPSRFLRSSSANLLFKPSFNLKFYGRRSFSFAAPELWNSIPENVRGAKSICIFKKEIKTWLFKKAFSLK